MNLGQAGFVFIEANVKKWGLAPMAGTLAPPPAYGSERGSILLEATGNRLAGGVGSGSSNLSASRRRIATTTTTSATTVVPSSPPTTTSSSRIDRPPSHKSRRPAPSPSTSLSTHHISPQALTTAVSAANALSSSSSSVLPSNINAQPIRPSPLRHHHARHSSTLSSTSASASVNASASVSIVGSSVESEEGGTRSGSESEGERNPPTPGLLDMSLHSLHRFPQRDDTGLSGSGSEGSEGSDEEEEGRGGEELVGGGGGTVVEPPAYHPIDPHVRFFFSSSFFQSVLTHARFLFL